MAKTIEEGFRLLKSNLEITGLQSSTASTRQANVRAALEDDFTILDSFLTGSYQRSTMIAPLREADIDIFVVLDPKYYGLANQGALLASVKRALRKTYPTTPDISPDGQAVTVTFTDFKVDVVPGFYRKDGGFLIPDSQLGRWIPTDPKKHVELWSAANRVHNGDLVPLIKMVKAWNKSRNLVRSFHLETLVMSVLQGVRISSFPSGLRYVFDKSRAKIKFKLADPAGYSDDVAAYLTKTEEMDKIIGRLDWAYATALEAEQLAANGRIREAFERWNLILKGYFPAYG
ncbi:CBASS oligonucleotide cyclase [Caulobacter segnis]|uniref:CBASS oligonucleotide cyclase n=1 Tax=Caulobacter segnis TaxID=88688 RepID=UPI002865FE02|nr:CBASS oligonucleotide cyclase [Caulobacter segnis]MDR6625696.1 hypothetical protein [Caulobacter segnis]